MSSSSLVLPLRVREKEVKFYNILFAPDTGAPRGQKKTKERKRQKSQNKNKFRLVAGPGLASVVSVGPASPTVTTVAGTSGVGSPASGVPTPPEKVRCRGCPCLCLGEREKSWPFRWQKHGSSGGDYGGVG